MKQIYYTILCVFTLLTISQTTQAQQYPLFSHYVLNDFAFNPAIAGTTDYVDLRGTYRTQWVGLEGAPKTSVISGHGKIKKLPIGVGGYLFRDEAGKLERTGGSVALSFAQQVSENTRFSVGFSAGYYRLGLINNLGTDDIGNDMALMNASNGAGVPDISAGVYLKHKGAYVGFSIPQIFKQGIKFTDTIAVNNELNRHYYGMVGYQLPISENIALEPSALFKFVQAAPVQFDATLRVLFKNSFWVGGSYRHQDAVAALIGARLNNKMTLAYAYDFTTSGLNEVSNGSHEITIGMRLGKKKDSDGDEVPDDEDKCPEEPGTKENDGCPDDTMKDLAELDNPDELDNPEDMDPLGDSDKDGVLNKDDKCPKVPGLTSNVGCPLGDRDNDGIRDDIDNCPDVAGLPSNTGCPLDDRDRDGIVDNRDKCPDIPGSFVGEGCPEEDTDGDGVADSIDKCPQSAGPYGGDGCPQVSASQAEILRLAIRNLYFDYDEDVIQREAYPFLDRLAELLVRLPDYKVKMTGFADERGSKAYNIDLSKRRVEAAFFYLTNRGVAGNQLLMNYYGEEDPADGRPTEAGFQMNRRVEMEFYFE